MTWNWDREVAVPILAGKRRETDSVVSLTSSPPHWRTSFAGERFTCVFFVLQRLPQGPVLNSLRDRGIGRTLARNFDRAAAERWLKAL